MGMRAHDVLASGVENTKALLGRYLKGFSDLNHTAQAHHLPNHVAWNLGHLALTLHRVAGRLDGGDLPASDFVPGTRGDAARFASEGVCFGSTPSPDASAYPSLARCVDIYDQACDRLARAVRNASDAQLTQQTPWGAPGQSLPMCDLISRMIYHNGFHTGQISDMRRAMGMGSALG